MSLLLDVWTAPYWAAYGRADEVINDESELAHGRGVFRPHGAALSKGQAVFSPPFPPVAVHSRPASIALRKEGATWRGMVGHGPAWQGKARHGKDFNTEEK
jgi:hypothetical protein